MTERRERTAGAEQRSSSVRDLVGSDRAMSTVLSFLGPALPTMEDSIDEGQFSGGRLREALAMGRVLPGVCVASPIKVGPAGAALLATDACLGELWLASGSSWPHVLDALKLNSGLRKLDFHWGTLGAGGVRLLCEALAVNVSLVDVDVSGCVFDRSGARAMAAVLSTTTSLQKLNLGDCGLLPSDVRRLAFALTGTANSSLKELHLGWSDVGEAGGCALAAALRTNSTLRVLRLSGTHLGDVGCSAMGVALATNTGICQLDLSENGLGELSGRAMAAALATNTTLCDLDLSWNEDFGGSGAVALFGALCSNHTLLELRLAGTRLGHASGVALANMVRVNSTLRGLDLSRNKLGRAEGGSGSCSWAQVLAALKDNTGLRTLSLQKCGLSADDGQALAEALQQRRSGLLRKLGLRDNDDIDDTSDGAIIAACLKPGSSVASLGRIGDFGAGPEAMHSLAEGLRQDNMLEVLDLSHIRLDSAESSWPELCAALAVNTRVHTLCLRGCNLTAGDGQALARALDQRPAGLLRELDVNHNKDLGDDACITIIIVACHKSGSALRKLDIGCSGAGLAVTLVLAGCLVANHTLEELCLWDMGADSAECDWSEFRTQFTEGEFEALAASLRTSRGMQMLYIALGAPYDNCAQIIAGSLATNTTLRRLHFYNHQENLFDDSPATAFRGLLQTNSTLRELVLNLSHASDAAAEDLKQAGRAKGCRITPRLFPF